MKITLLASILYIIALILVIVRNGTLKAENYILKQKTKYLLTKIKDLENKD